MLSSTLVPVRVYEVAFGSYLLVKSRRPSVTSVVLSPSTRWTFVSVIFSVPFWSSTVKVTP